MRLSVKSSKLVSILQMQLEAYILNLVSKAASNIYKSIAHINPFISITPSKPLMSSGSWLTLHNCEIFYLLAVNNDPATADLIFIRVNIYPGPGERGSLLIFLPIYFIRVTTYLPCVLTPQY